MTASPPPQGAPASRLRVADRYPGTWRDLPDLPLLAHADWHAGMAGRLDGRPVWLWLDGPDPRRGAGDRTDRPATGVSAGLAATLVTDPRAYAFGNLHSLLAVPSAPFAPPALRSALAALDDPGAIVAGLFPNLFVTHPGYATFPVGRSCDDGPSLAALLGAILAWSRQQGIGLVALPYTEAGGPLAQQAAACGFTAVPLTHDAYLDVPAGGFAGYLAGLPRHRRARIAAERRRLHGAGMRGRITSVIGTALLDRMADLRTQQRARYRLPARAAAERDRLERLLTALGGRVSVVLAGPDPAPVAFALLARDGDTWHTVCCGTDYADPRSPAAYFEVAYYAPLDHARGAAIRRISYGVGAERAKVLRGCRLVPLHCLMAGVTEPASRAVDALATVWRAAASGGPAAGAAPHPGDPERAR